MENPINLNNILTPKDISIKLILIDIVLIFNGTVFNKDKPHPTAARLMQLV